MSMLLAVIIHAEVITWVDENGVTHFSDKTPARYQGQSQSLKPKTNIIQSLSSTQKAQLSDSRMEAVEPTELEDAAPKIDICREKWALYERSMRCLSACGSDTSSFGGSGLSRRLNCGCPKIEAPDCAK